jgi:hypothetical protein
MYTPEGTFPLVEAVLTLTEVRFFSSAGGLLCESCEQGPEVGLLDISGFTSYRAEGFLPRPLRSGGSFSRMKP